jgi:hypothetical protein
MVSIFQHPFYPYCGAENPAPNMCNVPLPAGSRGDVFREIVTDIWMPALRSHSPQMIFISAGFDAHYEDDMGSLGLVEADYIWVTEQLKGVAEPSRPTGASYRCSRAAIRCRRWRARCGPHQDAGRSLSPASPGRLRCRRPARPHTGHAGRVL